VDSRTHDIHDELLMLDDYVTIPPCYPLFLHSKLEFR